MSPLTRGPESIDAETRPTLDETLMDVARVFARRGTCLRRQVGVVVTVSGRVVTTGYNGAPAGMPHCEHPPAPAHGTPASALHAMMVGVTEPRGCLNAVHAEANAVAFAARHGVSLVMGVMYTTMTPCLSCAQLIVNAGIAEVVADETYRDLAGWRLLEDAGVRVRML